MTNAVTKATPIIGFCAHSGTGKTTLLTRLLPLLAQRGLRVGVIKHAHHNFDTDQPGKDSYELRKAGAKRMLVSSSRRWALIHEHAGDDEAVLDELIAIMSHPALDLILIEGFKHERFDKIELHRKACGREPMYPQDDSIIAFVSDAIPPAIGIPAMDIDNIESVCDFIVARCHKS